MQVAIHNAQIIDPSQPGQAGHYNLLIDNGAIAAITQEAVEADVTIASPNLMVSAGWFDMNASIGDPGLEYKEDLQSAAAAAAAGGFTELLMLPNTQPVVQTKNEVAYIIAGNRTALTQIHPAGAITTDAKGERLTEMIDMHHAGAVAFTDGKQPLWNADVFVKALQYLGQFNGLLINKPVDRHLTAFGTMNEGYQSTLLGLSGMPNMAEELMIARDLRLLEYAGGRLHLANVSTAEGVALIKAAKAKGLHVTCDMAAHQLAFTDEVVDGYDTHYKVDPPFRTATDRTALTEAIADGTVDVLVSAHTPQDVESKHLEFDLADFGITGLQTFLPALQSQLNLSANSLVQMAAIKPRQLLNLPVPAIAVGAPANLTVFDPTAQWAFTEGNNLSKSANSPFLGQTLTGKVLATFNRGQHHINTY